MSRDSRPESISSSGSSPVIASSSPSPTPRRKLEDLVRYHKRMVKLHRRRARACSIELERLLARVGVNVVVIGAEGSPDHGREGADAFDDGVRSTHHHDRRDGLSAPRTGGADDPDAEATGGGFVRG